MTIDYFPSVTFLVPCWNEEKTVGKTIHSILELDYPRDKVRVIAIDDGSLDHTYSIISSFAKKDERVMALTKPNGGKYTALNLGLSHVDTDLVACLDADSTLAKNAMSVAAQYFKDPEIHALASCMQLRDIKSIWQRAQAVEYMLSVFMRKAYSTIDAIQVMPGPFSVFRTNVFEKVGHYEHAHNAEDFEMTLRLHNNHLKIANAHKAYVYTVGPSTLRGLLRQRVRWIQGFLENAWDYRHMFFSKKYGHFGFFTLPVAVIFIFYVIYGVSYTVLKFIELWYAKVQSYMAVGIHLPKFHFDIFYITTDVFLFQTIFLLTILAFVFTVSRGITQDKNPIVPNFAIYFLVYPFVLPVFVFIAVYKFLFKKENKWLLQDTKIQDAKV